MAISQPEKFGRGKGDGGGELYTNVRVQRFLLSCSARARGESYLDELR